MNFKETYKSANDKLCADHMIIDKIFEKSRKKTFYVYRSVFATVAAVLIFASIYAINSKPNTQDNAVVYHKSVPKTENNTSDQSVNENKSKVSAENPKGNMIMPESRAIIYDTADDSLPEEKTQAPASGGGTSSVMMNAYKERSEYITEKEYFDYLGFQFNEDVVLSNGMKIHYPESYNIVKNDDGNITDDSSVFTISCESRPDAAATLTAGKINPPQLPQDSCDIIAETRVCITQTDDNLSADFFVGNSWCSLVGTGLNLEEFTMLISEILTNKICQ